MRREVAVETGKWLAENFREFLKNGERSSIEARSSHWNEDDDVLHASATAKCPKRNGAKMAGELEDTFDDFSLLRMGQGNAMGHLLAQYAYWLQQRQNEAALKDEVLSLYVDHEHSLYDSVQHIAGSADIMAGFVNTEGYADYFPIEIKLTDAWKYGGITLDQFVQCAMYIRIKRREATQSANCNTGYVFSIYDKREAGVYWKVWTVFYDQKMDGYLLIADDELKSLNGFPSNGQYTFLPDKQLDVWINDHHSWMKLFRENPLAKDLPAPLASPSSSWECATIKEPDFRKVAWTDPATGEKYPAGSLKSGTGVVYVSCPLFRYCWPDYIAAWGLDPSQEVPKQIKMRIGEVPA